MHALERRAVVAGNTIMAQRDTARAALDRVRALHRPFDDRGDRLDCQECEGTEDSVPWPCPTIQAIDGKDQS